MLVEGGLIDGVPLRPAEQVGLGPVPLGVGDGDAAEEVALADEPVDGVDVARVGSALVADLKELARLAGREDHGPGLVERVGHLLLAVDVEPPPETGVGLLGVDPVGRRHDRRVEVLLGGEQLAEVLVDVGDVAVFLEVVAGVLAAVGPDVGDGDDADGRDAQHRLDEDTALGAAADDGHAELVGGLGGGGRRRGRVLGQDRPGQCDAEPGRGRGPEEIAAADPSRRFLDRDAHGIAPLSVEAASSYYRSGLPMKSQARARVPPRIARAFSS